LLYKLLVQSLGTFIKEKEVPHTKMKSFPGTRRVIEMIQETEKEKGEKFSL
jgi:hypothetical protein